MKGIIIKYDEDKRYGFIKDENQNTRFFHISSINQKNQFLNNILDYYFSNFIERKCYVVQFSPISNSKGLNAININLTNQIFNDMSKATIFDAEITDIEYDNTSLTRIISGMKNGSIPIGATAGSNGTYRIGYPEGNKNLNLYFRRINDIGWDSIEVRDLVLKINSRKKITKKFIENLKKKLIGKQIQVFPLGEKWNINKQSVLKV
jgi:hypothetical protein